MGTLFVFNGICFPLDIWKHDSSKCSEHKAEVSIGRQSALLSFSIQPPRVLSRSLETYKQNDKFQNFQYFCRFSENDDLFHFFTITCKNNFRCRMSYFDCKICSTKLGLQTLWECCLFPKKLCNQFDRNIHLRSDLSTTR